MKAIKHPIKQNKHIMNETNQKQKKTWVTNMEQFLCEKKITLIVALLENDLETSNWVLINIEQICCLLWWDSFLKRI